MNCQKIAYEISINAAIWLSGFISGIFMCLMFNTKHQEQRAIEKESAYYHPKTGEIVWSDNVVKFVVTGEE